MWPGGFDAMIRAAIKPAVRAGESRLRNLIARGVARRARVETALPWRSYEAADSHVFFGYHDITPFHPIEPRLLAHRTALGASPLRDPAEVGYFDRETGHFTTLGGSDLWCWQMGARLRWLRDGRVAWNALYDARTYGCVIADSESGRVLARLPKALYDVDPSERYGLSVDFSRLQRLRPGYGYVRLPDETALDPCPASTGIDLVSVETGRSERLISLAEIAAIDPRPGMAEATHYLNHLSFAPTGEHFCAFHLWQGPDGRRRLRHLVFDLSGRLAGHVPGQEHVSHFDWIGDGTGLLAFARLPGDEAPRYQFIDTMTGERRPICGAPTEDGHPMLQPGREPAFVSDTYPDRSSYRRLYLCDGATGATHPLAMFHSPAAFRGEARCDLHPRWSPDGRFIAVDSAHDDRRAMIVLDSGEMR